MKHRIFPFIILSVLVSIFPAIPLAQAEKALTCDLCGAAIKGQYQIYQGQGIKMNVCNTCAAKRPKCEICGIPMLPNQTSLIGGQTICNRCVTQAKVCATCGKLIQGTYWRASDGKRVFCDSCYNTLPRCSLCSLPIGNSPLDANIPLVHGKRICHNCYMTAPRCRGCGDPIVGLAYTYEGETGRFCSTCQAGPHCSACGLPLGDGGWELPDGRFACDTCNRTAVSSLSEAKSLMRKVQSLLNRELGITIRNNYDFQLVKKDNPDLQITSPVKNNELGLFVMENGKFSIYILGGLPRELFVETAAHELAHAWQAENCPLNQPPLIREGFAQWVAARILVNQRYDKTLLALARRKDVYGDGYRHFLNIENQQGRLQVFETAKQPGPNEAAKPKAALRLGK